MGIDGGNVPPFGGEKVDVIDLKSREVFSHEGRGVAALVEEPNLKIRQIGLEPGKEVPVHTADAPVTLQVVRGEGVFSAGEESVRMGPGKLLRIPEGASMGRSGPGLRAGREAGELCQPDRFRAAEAGKGGALPGVVSPFQ